MDRYPCPTAELDWLEADLETAGPTIVLAHQRLDVDTNVAVKNAAAVRERLEKSGRVLAVFQGHSHENDYSDLHGIHYCTLAAMVEGTGPKATANPWRLCFKMAPFSYKDFADRNLTSGAAKRRRVQSVLV